MPTAGGAAGLCAAELVRRHPPQPSAAGHVRLASGGAADGAGSAPTLPVGGESASERRTSAREVSSAASRPAATGSDQARQYRQLQNTANATE